MAAAQVQSARPLCTCPPVRTASPATRVASAPPYRPMDASGSCCSPERVKAPSVEPAPSLVSASILLSVCGWPAVRPSVCLSVCLPACLPACLSGCLAVWLPGCLAIWLSGCLSGCLPQHRQPHCTALQLRQHQLVLSLSGPVAPCSSLLIDAPSSQCARHFFVLRSNIPGIVLCRSVLYGTSSQCTAITQAPKFIETNKKPQ